MYMALVRHWLHHKESDDPAEFKREIVMARFLERRAFEMMHPPEK